LNLRKRRSPGFAHIIEIARFGAKKIHPLMYPGTDFVVEWRIATHRAPLGVTGAETIVMCVASNFSGARSSPSAPL
jgi:hypothetical protein